MSGNGVPMPVAPHNRTPSGPYPGQGREYGGVANGGGGGLSGFMGARSPPKSKNTSHVPCKFYPFGQCQAGAACQFSHDLDPMTQNAPCKYFAKGSCKFGQTCALAHILPDGRVINRPSNRGSGYNRRGTHPTSMLNVGPPDSLMSVQANDSVGQHDGNMAFPSPDPSSAYAYHLTSLPFGSQQQQQQQQQQQSMERSSPYGSPYGDGRLATSPGRPGLSVLDVPLPKSFDSQGISQAARHGPFASSVPSRFGIESPPSSLPIKAQLGNTSLRDSTFGDTANLDGVLHGLGSSPREQSALDFSKRPLHSERFARSRPMLMSSSLDVRPTLYNVDTDESEQDSEEGYEEDLLPSSLHDLLPPEKLRRSSRNTFEDESNALPMTSAQRRAISNGNPSQDSKVGSLSPHSGSPSRYSALWARSGAQKGNTESNLGVVGSPHRPSNLRTSSLSTSAPRNTASSPNQSMSILSSQLQRTNLGDNSKSSTLHPGVSRNVSSSASVNRNGLGDRGFSSSSIGRDKIDEETMFSMEEDGEGSQSSSCPQHQANGSAHERRGSNSFFNLGKGAVTLGPIGGQRQGK